MGRRLNTSRPTVIQTMLPALSDMFTVQPNDTLEQWYYVNTGEYSPDRTQFPLQLTPTIVSVDTEAEVEYHPTFANVVWYYFDPTNNTDYSSDEFWPGLHWVRITAVSPSIDGELNDYFCPTDSNPNFKLYVQKNIAPPSVGSSDAGQNICCVATYVDPRDSGVTNLVRETVLLTSSKHAINTSLKINLLAPTKTIYNVLTSASSLFSFQAQILNSKNEDVTSSYYIEWYGKENNATTESLINSLHCYRKATQQASKGQGTDTITLDAMYTENITIVCKVKETSTSPILPAVAYCSLVWEFPRIDPHTICNNGSVVNAAQRNMTFTNIVNYKGGVLTDAQKAEHLLFNYKRRVSTASSYTDMGWGQSLTVPSNDLKQTSSYSTPVHAEVYMLGAYDVVTDDGSPVTDDNELVFDRL